MSEIVNLFEKTDIKLSKNTDDTATEIKEFFDINYILPVAGFDRNWIVFFNGYDNGRTLFDIEYKVRSVYGSFTFYFATAIFSENKKELRLLFSDIETTIEQFLKRIS